MTILTLAAMAALQSGPLPLPVTVPEAPGVSADPTCGGRAPLAGIAFCYAMTQAAVEGVVEVYNADFARQGWLAADGADNRVVFVRRKEGGGCDAFQLLAFPGPTAGPTAPAYVALATVPGDPCTAANQAAQQAPQLAPQAAPQ